MKKKGKTRRERETRGVENGGDLRRRGVKGRKMQQMGRAGSDMRVKNNECLLVRAAIVVRRAFKLVFGGGKRGRRKKKRK